MPSIPTLFDPKDEAVVGSQPLLGLMNSSDSEDDTLWYDFEVYGDSDLTMLESIGLFVPGWTSPTQTSWQVNVPLTEDAQHWWRARAFDGYEYSEWTLAETFWVNATESAPGGFGLIGPLDSVGRPIFDMKPTFIWSFAADPDPFDTVRYKLELALDSTFLFKFEADSIKDTSFVFADSIEFSTHYWWRVTAFDLIGNQVTNPFPKNFWTWTLGDVDRSHLVDIADLTYLVAFMFGGGAAMEPLFVADVNGDCSVDISDLTYFVAFMFGGGPEPKVGCE